MKTAVISSLGNPNSFDLIDKTNPLYYIARYSHEMSMNLYALSQASFQWEQGEVADYATEMAAWDVYSTSLEIWFTDAVAASDGGLPIPAPPSLPALPGISLPSLIINIVLRVGIKILINWLRKKLDPTNPAGEISQILERALLTGGGEPLISLLAAVPLEIIVNHAGAFEDFLYRDK